MAAASEVDSDLDADEDVDPAACIDREWSRSAISGMLVKLYTKNRKLQLSAFRISSIQLLDAANSVIRF